MATKKSKFSVAEYLEQQINLCEKSQREICEEIGYDKPNIITMFKQGKTKLPLNKVPLMAKALGVDQVHLLRIVMGEYMPDSWAVIEDMIGRSMISHNEAAILRAVRESGGGLDVFPANKEDRDELGKLVAKWRDRAEKSSVTAHRKSV